MKLIRWTVLSLIVLTSASGARAQQTSPAESDGFGLLVMAHGGTLEWNQAVLDAVTPLAQRFPVEVAFGMADACSIQASVHSLEAKGVRKAGVVRLFVSGESWYERTEQILGIKEGAPSAGKAGAPCGDAHGSHAAHGGHSMAFFRVDTGLAFALTKEGLSEAPEMGPILAERAKALSQSPAKEDVLILAHGPGDDAENERWIANIDARAEAIRKALPFHEVSVMTLREDWPEKRVAAEEKVKAFVGDAAREGRRAIVIPFRLFGFGPYDKVLEGQEYAADSRGFLPHENVTRWITRQAEELRAGAFATSVAAGITVH